jgi:probable F420-dependent oxidoreductase
VKSEVQKKKFRFGVTGRGGTLKEWCDFARKAEDLGYSTLVIGDHVGRFLAPFSALVAAAQVTTSLRFAVQVLVNDLRHPAIVAQEAVTADVLTEGRFELGLGAGSLAADRRLVGLPQDSPGSQVERVAESVDILKAFFTRESVTFEGKHYQIEDLRCYPKPVQRPFMPLMIGGSGPRMLRLAARDASIVSILTESSADHMSGNMADKIAVVRQAAGDRYGDREIHTWFTRVQVDGRPSLADMPGREADPVGLSGSFAEVSDRLIVERDLYDVSYITITGAAIDAFAPVVQRLGGR